ncbi:MAG: acylphosphatase [Alphaproteobacteria bacterium]|jgi:acylphosphatase|nr:acylphosphatase [Alphaproteobacteria bacterium]MDP6874596.1 acylphosphatase [Alphaproteobacteria bacterium]
MTYSDHPDRCVRVVIEGRVQGVWYRGWTVDTAEALGLCGWVRNRRDGSVEAVFSGPAAAVDAMLARCHQGPSAARIDSVTTAPWSGKVGPDFRQEPTA